MLKFHGSLFCVEFKYQYAPRFTPSMRSALQELSLAHLWVIYPGEKSYPLDDRITVLPIGEIDRVKFK